MTCKRALKCKKMHEGLDDGQTERPINQPTDQIAVSGSARK